MPLTIDFALRVLNARVLGIPHEKSIDLRSAKITSVTIDSRTACKGSLFACIKGEHSDGHDFATSSVENGSIAILAERNPFEDDEQCPVPVFIVENTTKALQDLAVAWRDVYQKNQGKVIAVTGTSGKTTVKELLTHIISKSYGISSTHGNLNNSLGVPLSILNADEKSKYWIIEVGISHVGDMDELGKIVRPNVAVIVNAGIGHTEGLGEKTGVAHEKAQILRYLVQDGVAIINRDYPELLNEAQKIRSDLLLVSTSNQNARFIAQLLHSVDSKHSEYRLFDKNQFFDIKAPLIGDFVAEDIIATYAVVNELGIDIKEFADSIESFRQPNHRFSRFNVNNWLIVDDCYNANPLSMSKSIESFFSINDANKSILMLGSMEELGNLAPVEHEKLGMLIAKLKPTAVFWTGNFFDSVQNGLISNLDSKDDVLLEYVKSPEQFIESLEKIVSISHGGGILFKGSRIHRLEYYIEAFKQAVI